MPRIFSSYDFREQGKKVRKAFSSASHLQNQRQAYIHHPHGNHEDAMTSFPKLAERHEGLSYRIPRSPPASSFSSSIFTGSTNSSGASLAAFHSNNQAESRQDDAMVMSVDDDEWGHFVDFHEARSSPLHYKK